MLNKLDRIIHTTSTLQEAKHSTFQGYAALVNNAEHVRLAFLKIKRLEVTADHVMMAYRICEEADVHQGSVSNGEHFGDVEVMKVLESHNYVNIVVFIAQTMVVFVWVNFSLLSSSKSRGRL